MSVLFDQLRISDDGRELYIDAHINKSSDFADTTIGGLYICLGSKIYETETIDPESNGFIYSKVYDEEVTEIHEVIHIGDEDLQYNKTLFKDLFFVYVKCNNLPDDGCCYTAVGDYVLGVTFDENLLYQKAMQFTKGLTNKCEIPVGFTDFILLWNAFKASVETEHYIPAIKYYNMLFDNTNGISITKGCGCNG